MNSESSNRCQNKLDTEFEDSTLLRNSLREAKWILLIWCGCFLWVIGYCCLNGYQTTAQPLQLTFGFPSWVFWGVLMPWLLATTISVWFALLKIQNDSLEIDSADAVDPANSAEVEGDGK
ncbi:YhdT family protein [Stieleria sp. JC731]|uniref:DUF997 family protein n=1 Tax=Pirellulaceae TaxID=2691357 RepID=UPI001E4DA0A7|nr:DUF997 family protein [Stieleria sp. JC731]MCC9598941.1 YhdT family protein [Stieleria sp. JC731]